MPVRRHLSLLMVELHPEAGRCTDLYHTEEATAGVCRNSEADVSSILFGNRRGEFILYTRLHLASRCRLTLYQELLLLDGPPRVDLEELDASTRTYPDLPDGRSQERVELEEILS